MECNGRYRKYKSGQFLEESDERFQLGMRMANDLGMDTLYSIDGGTMAEDIENLDSVYSANLWKDFDFKSNDPYEVYLKEWFEANDILAKEMNMPEYFKLINSEKSHQYGYRACLIGDFKLDNKRGADILSFWWNNRNVRIFRKLQTITNNQKDRILVIFRNDHPTRIGF